MHMYKTNSLLSLLYTLLLFVIFSSCQKSIDYQNETISAAWRKTEVAAAISLVTTSPNLIYEEVFEGIGPYFFPGTLQIGTSYGFKLASDPVFQGVNVGRFELRDTDPSVSSGTRAEAKFPPLTNKNRWYSYAVYFPSSYYKYDSKAEIISQWHQGGGVNPPISIITRYDKMYVEIRSSPDNKKLFELGSITKDKWQTLVFHINHLSSSSGLVEIWRNGSKVFTYNGKNSYDYSVYDKPVWKLGLYKWEWNGTKTTDVSKRVIYFDNVRVGNENASYADMVMPASKDLNPPGTINSFTLINAETEKDILTITEGAVISLAKLGTTKLNIRANPGTPFGSLKFELTGPQSRTHKDNYAPYSLMGDTDGNYYFGTWGPPPTGNYKLKASPYSLLDATGLAGVPLTVNFSFTK